MLKVATNLASRSSSLIHFNLRGLFRWKFSVTCLVKNRDQFSQFKFKPLLRKFHEIEHSETLLLNREWYFQKTNSTSFDVTKPSCSRGRFNAVIIRAAVHAQSQLPNCPLSGRAPSHVLLLPSQPSFCPPNPPFCPLFRLICPPF